MANDITSAPDPILVAHANAIRELGRKVVLDVIEIGEHLRAAQEHLSRQADGDGEFLAWVAREFPSWSRRSVYRFIDTYKLAASGEFAKLANSNIDLSGLYLLAAPGTPDAAREEALRRVSAGETLRHADVREIVAVGRREIIEAARRFSAQDAAAHRAERIARIGEISTRNAPLPIGRRFPIIYADPPWKYENPAMGSERRKVENHYPTMTLEEIIALPVADLATEDALLYLWSTAPKLADALSVIVAWGFDYRTCGVWDKEVMGMGYHFRNQHEQLLVAKRGDMPAPAMGDQPPSVYRERRTEHSVKPSFYYEMIEKAYPTLPKIELFARHARPGWEAWGNQAPPNGSHDSEKPPPAAEPAPAAPDAEPLLAIPEFLRRGAP